MPAWVTFGIFVELALLSSILRASEPLTSQQTATEQSVRTAVERGLAVLQNGARNYPKNRQCFSCHHQTLPLLAMARSKPQGIKIDEKLYSDQLAFTRESFLRDEERLRSGKAVDGAALTVGYGLWTFEMTDPTPSKLTEAMVHNLIRLQREDGSWHPEVLRPPMEESVVTCTVLAAFGIQKFATDEQQGDATQTIAKAKRWLTSVRLSSNEDHVSRLWGACLLKEPSESQRTVCQQVLDLQHDDGGWGQEGDRPSDAYSTGMTMFVLQLAGLADDTRAMVRGRAFLLRTQRDDGSWHVPSRATPVQEFFDNGDPHGKDQFLSMAATGWAVTALAPSVRRVSGP